MPIPMESPPAMVSPTRGDSFFDQGKEKLPRQHQERGPGFTHTRGIKRSKGGYGQEKGNVDGFKSSPRDIHTTGARESRTVRGEQRSITQEQESISASPLALEFSTLFSPKSEITLESIAGVVGVLGEVTTDLGGKNFYPIAEAARTRQEARAALGSQIQSFTEGVSELVGELNPQRVKELSKLNFSGSGLEALRPLVKGLSERNLDAVRKDIRTIITNLKSSNFDLTNLEQSFKDFLESSNGKTLVKGLLVAAGVVGATAMALGSKDKRTRAIITALSVAIILSCCGPGPTASATETVTNQPLVGVVGATEIITPTEPLPATPSVGAPASPTAEVGRPTPLVGQPTLEQARVDKTASLSPETIRGVESEISRLETIAKNQIPQAASVKGYWNGAAYENTNSNQASRIVVAVFNSSGEFLWSLGSEWPIVWILDEDGEPKVAPDQVFFATEGESLTFTGNEEGTFGYGEKPILVDTPVSISGPNGTEEYYLRYCPNPQEGIWFLNTEVLEKMDERVQNLRIEGINSDLAIAVDPQAAYDNDEIEIKAYFDLSKQEWIFPAEEGQPMKFVNNMDGIEGRTAIITTLVTVDETATIQPPPGTIKFSEETDTTAAGIRHFSLEISNINVAGYKIEEIVFNPGPNQIRMPGLHLWGAYRGADGEKHILEVQARDGWKPIGEDTTFKITEDSMEETYSPGTKMSAFLAVVAQENSAARFRNWLEENNLTRSIYMLGGFGDIPLAIDELKNMLLNSATEWVKLPLNLVRVITINPGN